MGRKPLESEILPDCDRAKCRLAENGKCSAALTEQECLCSCSYAER